MSKPTHPARVISLSPTPGALAPAPDESQLAFERTRARRDQTTPLPLARLAFDLPGAVIIVRAALPRVRAMREQILALGALPAEHFDALDDTAQAAWHAQNRWIGTTQPLPPLADLVARAAARRDLLMNAAIAAADKGYLPRARLRELGGGRAAIDIALHLDALRGMLYDAWPALVGRTALDASDLDDAAAVVAALRDTIAQRMAAQTAVNHANEERLRAATMLAVDWDEVRHAVRFIRRHEGDVETIAPTLHRRSASRRDGGAANGGEE